MYVIVLDSNGNKRRFMDNFKPRFKPYRCADARELARATLDPSQTYIIYGILRGCGDVLKQCMRRKIRYIYIDNAYFPTKRKINYSVTWGDMQNTTFDATTRYTDLSRSDAILRGLSDLSDLSTIREHGTSAAAHVLICPPSNPTCEMLQAHRWLEEVVTHVRSRSGIRIVIRPKLGHVNFDLEGIAARHKHVYLSSNPDLKKDLAGAVCACIFNSRVAIEAVVAGVPVYTSRYSIAHPLSQKSHDICDPTPYDAEAARHWLEFAARSEFSPEEIRKGCRSHSCDA